MILSRAGVDIPTGADSSTQRTFGVVWSKLLVEHKGLKYMPAFIRLKERDLELLIHATFKTYTFSKDYVTHTKQMVKYLETIKSKCDGFDNNNPSEEQQVQFITDNKSLIFPYFNVHAKQIWDIVKQLPKDEFRQYQRYYQFMLFKYFGLPSEINTYIYRKPLGYAGDYVMMNYIYAYHDSKYLGDSTYAKLINHYTCTIPVSYSNILRYRFIKNKIYNTVSQQTDTKILSIGSGSAKEITDILRENKPVNHFTFQALDFEPAAITYLKSDIGTIPDLHNKCHVNYLNYNIRDLFKDEKLLQHIGTHDMVYVAGVYDYLNDKIAARLTKTLYNVVKPGCSLTIFNISTEHEDFRGFYELFGDWTMYHRTKEDVLTWLRNLPYDTFSYSLDLCGTYWLLTINKHQ